MEIRQARILEWVAIPSSRGSSQPTDRTQVSCIAGGFFTIWATRKAIDRSRNSEFNSSEEKSSIVWKRYLCVRKIPWRKDGLSTPVFLGFLGGSDCKGSTCNVGDLGLTPGLGRSPGVGKGYPLQYSCLENSTDRGAFGLQSRGSQRVRYDRGLSLHFALSSTRWISVQAQKEISKEYRVKKQM